MLIRGTGFPTMIDANDLRLAGTELPLFEPPTIEAIFQSSTGLLRKANSLAHHALFAAAIAKAKSVTTEHLETIPQTERSARWHHDGACAAAVGIAWETTAGLAARGSPSLPTPSVPSPDTATERTAEATSVVPRWRRYRWGLFLPTASPHSSFMPWARRLRGLKRPPPECSGS